MTLVERINQICKTHRTSISKLEKVLEFSNGAMYKWDECRPTIDRVQKVADYFGVSIDFLVRGCNGPKIDGKTFDGYSVIELVRGTGLSVNQIITALDQAKSTVLDEAVVGKSLPHMATIAEGGTP
jgi:hypothetical protein